MQSNGRVALVAAWFGLVFALPGICPAQDSVKAVTPTGRSELFNGKDFTGWTFFMRSNAEPARTWSVTNGVIHCTGRPAGYARTEANYRDYKLTVEWRFVQTAPKADNSGIFLHLTGPDKVWPTCFECQGQHGHQGDIRFNGNAACKEQKTAETRQISTIQSANEKPVGEWDTLQAECSGSAIKLWVNGKFMNEITGCNVASGAIGIQSEGGEIEVRKIVIEPLKTP